MPACVTCNALPARTSLAYPSSAFSLPAVIAGVVAPIVGLATAAEIYGLLVILLALASLLAMILTAPRQ
jgi:hypothetical protein